MNLIEFQLLKSRSGVYKDTPENRRLHTELDKDMAFKRLTRLSRLRIISAKRLFRM